jgi:hypothetical protein
MTHRWKNLAAALLLLAAGGVARIPLEERYTASMREQQLLEPPLNLSLRDELGQTFFIAVLGGFRSVVATIMELKTVEPYIEGNWGLVDQYYAVCCKLQPLEESYWDRRAWQLGANARDSYLYDIRYTEETRHLLAQQSIQKCMDVLLEGTRHRPDSAKLWERLGWYAGMPWNDLRDHAKASEYYARAAATPNARGFYRRFSIYEMAHVPGRELEAWHKLMELYQNPDDCMPRVKVELLRLYRRVAAVEPSIELPPELVRLTDRTSILTPQEKKEQFEINRALERMEARDQERPPVIQSPGLEKSIQKPPGAP